MNTALAELIGMHLGDGTLYKTNTGYVWELRGDLKEQTFYENYVQVLILEATKELLTPKKRTGGKNGCFGFRCCKTKFTKKLIQLGLPVGKKENVGIPKKILFGSLNVQRACLRGLFATDGTAYVVKINKQTIATYPIVEFVSTSKQLRDDTVLILKKFDLDAKTWTYSSKKNNELPAYYLRLSGKKKTRVFQEQIGLSNPKHFSKLNNNV